ncbi:alpha-glucosidase/alpha-galactosidase [Ignisphaera sp. 4213-co]|uniref:Alpha-glucosidase/alpha-galactosidase n=1 Tax=Ignisphaera cupida TaxID=3050454 RepID=A0ABD4Z6B9_9CREN|nr:alpha-glucosidase/alpha-galactosidase [Ignisphaera sp. 4213-co]MDK6028867.1 alpha-glucosidase/alpha-galactosidase [Ignisphaera sp. 4213-co]
MVKGPKIAFIGAGSARWTSRILIDIFLNKDLQNSEIWLMDIDDYRLSIIGTFAKRYVEELKLPTKVFATKDRKEAIKNADFVISTVLAKGYTYYETMREISERHGYKYGINSVEWNYVGDYHTIWGYHQFKVHLEIARDIEELAPNAWFFIVANPVLELTTLIGRETKVKVAGICHGFLGFRAALEILAMRLSKEKLGKDITALCAMHHPECTKALLSLINFDELEFEMKGFNHVIWLTKFRYMGENAYRYVDEWIKEDAEKYWSVWREYTHNPWDVDLAPAAIDMYKTYGYLPIGDSVRGGTWKYHWDLQTKKYWYGPYGGPDSEIGNAIRFLNVRRIISEMARVVFDTSTPLVQREPPRPSGELLVPLMDALYNNKSIDSYELPTPADKPLKAPLYVNIMNNGALPELPNNIAVEVPVKVDGKGIHPKPVEPIPPKILRFVLMHRLMRAEWALQAFLEGGRDALFNWLIVDVRTKSVQQVNDVIDAILKMPGNEEMAKHFS